MSRTAYLVLVVAVATCPVRSALAPPPPRQKQLTFTLGVSLEFKGRTVSGLLPQSEIPGLLDLPVRNGDTDPKHKYGVVMTTADKKTVTVYTCREWLRARQRGEYSATTYDMAMESFLIDTCGLLYQLQDAKPPVRSFIENPRVTLADLSLLPAEMLASMPDTDRLRGKTVAQVVPSKDLVKVSPQEIRLTYGGLRQWFAEVGRADFNDDGIEDIFVFTGAQAEGGTMRIADYLVLTRTAPSGPLRIIEPATDPLKSRRDAGP